MVSSVLGCLGGRSNGPLRAVWLVPGLGSSLLKPLVEGDTVLSAPLGESLARHAVSDISLLDPFPESGSVCPNRKQILCFIEN